MHIAFNYGSGHPEVQAWAPNPECPERERWHAHAPMGTEVEVLYWLTATVAMLKPRVVVESGTHAGLGAIALGHGLQVTGEGHLWTVEADVRLVSMAQHNIMASALDDWVTIVHGDDVAAMCGERGLRPELYFCDSFEPVDGQRAGEIRRMLPHMAPGAVILVHDTEQHWSGHLAAVRSIAADGLVTMVELPTPRGIAVLRVPVGTTG